MKKEESNQGNIPLILNSYDDIFSDFDPRGFNERALSDDFLQEAKRAARDKDGKIELILMIPKAKRSSGDEFKIKKRLNAHFIHHFSEEERKVKRIKTEGILWFFIGGVLMFLAALLYQKEGFIFIFLEILLTPAGWFMFWEGLDKVFITARESEPEYRFYKKMINADIMFESY